MIKEIIHSDHRCTSVTHNIIYTAVHVQSKLGWGTLFKHADDNGKQVSRKHRDEDDAIRKKRYMPVVAPGGHFFSNSASTVDY